MKLTSFVRLPLAALVSACTTQMPTMMDADVDAQDVTMDSGITDRPDVPNGTVTDVTDVTDVPENDVPENDVRVSDVPENDVGVNDVTSSDVRDVTDVTDAPNVMDVPNVIADTGVCPMGTMVCGMMGCVNFQTDNNHCGMCANACPMNQLCVAGECRVDCPMPNSICGAGAMITCRNLQNDLANCGICGNVCSVTNGTPGCNAGSCTIASCNAGFGNCDMNAANGCETNTTNTVAHCGACGNVCPAVANGVVSCSMSVCAPTCNAGFERLGTQCVSVGAFPRPILPLSLGNVSLRRPTLRWQLPAGTSGALVDLCRDRACTMVIESIRAVGTSARPMLALPANSVVFWRLRATVGMATSVNFSPTWLFHVPATDNSGNVDTSANAHLDVNGDGFDDVVIGSITASPGARMFAGTASVFHGSAGGVPMVPARVLEGVAAFDNFGNSVASAGDVNGDGFGDLVIGASAASPGGRRFAGTASVFHGSAGGVPMAPATVFEGVAASDNFGNSVASAGDVNGDGFGDLVIGASAASPGGRRFAGRVSVFHGNVGGVPMAPARVLEGVAASDYFGNSVASAGDVNGDGFGDLVVGASFADLGGRVNVGTASVFHGSAGGVPMAPTIVLEGVALRDYFGNSVASAGDVNGDGFGDLVIGAASAVPGDRVIAGRASVFHGSAGGVPMAPATVLEGVAVSDNFGNSVASAGDVNGDGFGDLVIGASSAFPGGRVNAGTASVFHGSAGGVPMAPARVLEGVAANDYFGNSVASAGDVNGDGFGDLVVGAAAASPGGRVNAGTASVFHGGAGGVPMAPTRVLEGVAANDYLGYSVANLEALGSWRRARTASLWRDLATHQQACNKRPNRA